MNDRIEHAIPDWNVGKYTGSIVITIIIQHVQFNMHR